MSTEFLLWKQPLPLCEPTWRNYAASSPSSQPNSNRRSNSAFDRPHFTRKPRYYRDLRRALVTKGRSSVGFRNKFPTAVLNKIEDMCLLFRNFKYFVFCAAVLLGLGCAAAHAQATLLLEEPYSYD